MEVIRRYMHNPLRNFNYLLGCEETRQAIVLDPLDGEAMVQLAREQDWNIKLIINTHEHFDHIQGNPAVQAATGAPIWAHSNANIPNQSHGIQPGEVIEIGTMRLKALHTPGHTPVHVCLLSEADAYNAQPILFSGDTLFNACAGNCKNGGDVNDMYDTFVSQLMPLSDETLLHPGHDYMKNNLGFALDREPDNQMAQYWQDQVAALDEDNMPVMTLGHERQYNPFLRLHEPVIRARLQEQFPHLGQGDRDVFKALRALRDQW